jgi:hypothetical protein
MMFLILYGGRIFAAIVLILDFTGGYVGRDVSLSVKLPRGDLDDVRDPGAATDVRDETRL